MIQIIQDLFISLSIEEKTYFFFGLIVLFLGLFNIFKKYAFVFYLIFCFPGVFFHELLHLIMALITFGKPRSFTLIPRKVKDGWVLGQVQCSNVNWLNAWLIGLAPLILTPLVFFSFPMIIELEVFSFLLFTYISSTIVEASLPSLQDLKVASKSWLILVLIVIGIILYIFKDSIQI